jgi:hypothetical protein
MGRAGGHRLTAELPAKWRRPYNLDVKEYDLYIPLHYSDGSKIAVEKLQQVQAQIVDRFGGLTHFPQVNIGLWKLGKAVYRDEIVIFRVLSSESQSAETFLRELKRTLKAELKQEEILILIRDVKTL